MLSPYRVLDLTDGSGLLCGKLLGDLGADVIKIERPGGDPARRIGPFYQNEPDPEKSLFWWAFNTSKRGITLDIENVGGKEIFKRLVKTSDFVIESFPPGYMSELGLGFSELGSVNPGVILVSISPFGQTGPYRDYKAPDIVAFAMGGLMYSWGERHRPPVRISHHSQAYLHAGAEAAVAALLALWHRNMTGEGQQVDLSIQEAVVRCTAERQTSNWDMMKIIRQRGQVLLDVRVTRVWPCKDGHVVWHYWSGQFAKRFNLPLVKWMESEGMADDFLKGLDWDTFDLAATTQEVVDRIGEPTRKFFMAHTKAELLEGALKHRVMLYPMSTAADIPESDQLAARGFWVKLEHPELGTTITYPGAFVKAPEAPLRILRRAPLIGEHNQEVLEGELGVSLKESSISKRAKAYQANRGESEEKKKLLGGIKVVEFGSAFAGPLTLKTFSDYGAEVIKVESRNRPDVHRTLGPFKDGIVGLNRSGQFNQDNTGKLSVAFNLTHPKGVEIAKRLIARADIVVENFAAGVMERMGLGYEELKKVKPDIIMLSTCMMGHTGPYATQPGYGYQLTALAGFNEITGWPDGEAAYLSSYTDFIAPHFNVLAILSALDYRCRTGKGQYLDMAQYENGIHFLSPLFLDYMVNGRVAGRMGNRYQYAAPHNAYCCLGEDRWCAIAVFTEDEWESFGKVIGNPAWVNSPKFATLLARKENEDELDKLVEEWTVKHSAEEVMTMMQTAGVAAGVLESGQDLLEHDPQLRHRHFFWELDHPEVGRHRVPASSFVLSKSPYELRRAALLGEHNEYALKELLGMSDEEIAELVIEGVIE